MNPEFVRVAAWRDRLARERASLCQTYLEKPRVAPLLSGLSRLTDSLLMEIWNALDLPARAALVAVGGYGRGELFPQSDVDVLILLDDGLGDAERARLEPLIALLWDVGLPIGSSVRDYSECLSEARGDITIQTNLLESRWLAGHRPLFRRLREALAGQMDVAAFFQAKTLEQKIRHGRHTDVALLLEPNLKESPGGLRDVQTMLWIAQAAGLAKDLGGLARAGLLNREEARAAAADLRLLNHLRIRLHLQSRRREDRLLYEFQEPIALAMGVTASHTRRASERLMQRYFLAARHVRLVNELVVGELRTRLLPPAKTHPLSGSPGFQAAGHLLDAPEDLFVRQPDLLLETFLVLAREAEVNGCTPRLLRALWRAGRTIDAAFRGNPANHRRFLDLLAQPRGVTLCMRLMHRLGILGRYIPAFGRITGQMQHDGFHIYPVDEHTLMVLRNLRRLAVPEFAHEFPLAHRLMGDCKRQDILLLAALFHDIAKGRGGDHSSLGAMEARRFCKAHGLPGEDAEAVAWLVAEHLTLSRVAQKQDLSDPEVIAAFAGKCGDLRRLTALYLLTVADIRGTSPKVWNAWKDKLTRELYLAARRVLEGGAPESDSVEEKKEQARANLRLYGFAPGSESALWERLDDVFFLRQDARDIAWQTRRLLPVLNRAQIIVRARLAPVGEGVEVLVFAPDEEALFARICAFFARLGYSILAARIHTTRDGSALDTFYAFDPEQRQVAYRDFLNYIEHELAAELGRHGPAEAVPPGRVARRLKAFPIEPQVSLSPSDNGRDYVLTLTAGDRPGLLANVARHIHQHGASVLSARINTLGNRAEDVFVLAGDDLNKAGARLALEQDLLESLRI
ncbi:MAG: [protein-PII] uridylyltransferase [Pseudomonadota bacterium]